LLDVCLISVRPNCEWYEILSKLSGNGQLKYSSIAPEGAWKCRKVVIRYKPTGRYADGSSQVMVVRWQMLRPVDSHRHHLHRDARQSMTN